MTPAERYRLTAVALGIPGAIAFIVSVVLAAALPLPEWVRAGLMTSGAVMLIVSVDLKGTSRKLAEAAESRLEAEKSSAAQLLLLTQLVAEVEGLRAEVAKLHEAANKQNADHVKIEGQVRRCVTYMESAKGSSAPPRQRRAAKQKAAQVPESAREAQLRPVGNQVESTETVTRIRDAYADGLVDGASGVRALPRKPDQSAR